MTWVSTTTGRMVNLDHITEIGPHARDGSRPLWGGDKRIGETLDDVDILVSPVIPAAVGTTAWLVSFYKFDRSMDFDLRTVVAWRLIQGWGAMPILAGEELSGNQRILVILPNGGCEDSWNATYSNREDAEKAIRQEIFGTEEQAA